MLHKAHSISLSDRLESEQQSGLSVWHKLSLGTRFGDQLSSLKRTIILLKIFVLTVQSWVIMGQNVFCAVYAQFQ